VLRATVGSILHAAWLAGVPYWDAKLRIGEHLWSDAQDAEAVLKRLRELLVDWHAGNHRALVACEVHFLPARLARQFPTISLVRRARS